MKTFKILYYLVLSFIVTIAILLIVSAFPIPANYKVLTVVSGSMEPKIKLGSIVIIKPAKEYKIGDVITFGPIGKNKSPITHRIYDIKLVNGQPIYITKGDANNDPDSREVQKKEVVGKVLISIPFIGHVIDFAKKPLGFGLIIIIPSLLIIIDEIKIIIKEIKKKNDQAKKEQTV